MAKGGKQNVLAAEVVGVTEYGQWHPILDVNYWPEAVSQSQN